MVKAAWFRNYAANERPEEFDRIVQSWDTANKATELSDFSVCTSWGIKGKNLYLLHVLRKRMEYPELKRAVREQCEAFEANVVLIEDKASGTQLIQEMIQEGLHAVTGYQPQSDKIMRMHARTAMIENGFVHLPKEAAWLAEYLHELTVFPNGKHDDQVDSTAQMLDWFKQAGRGPSPPWARAASRRFPGDPSQAFALLQDPGRAGKTSPLANTGLQLPLSALRRATSPPPAQDSLPASGLRLYREGVEPSGSLRKVSG